MREKRCEGDHTVAPSLLHLAPPVALEGFEGGSPRERLIYIRDLEVLCLLQEGEKREGSLPSPGGRK